MRVSYLNMGSACIPYPALGLAPTRFKRIWREEEGFLTFEWILLITLLLIGILGAISGVRDAINAEMAGVAGAIVNVDPSFSICTPLNAGAGNFGSGCCFSGGVGSSYERVAPSYGAARTTHATAVSAVVCTSG